MKHVRFYNEILEKEVYAKIQDDDINIRNRNFRKFAEEITEYIAEKGSLKPVRKKRASKKAAEITGVKPETAEKYLGILEENGYVGFKKAGVSEVVGQKIELEDMEIQPQVMDEPTVGKGIRGKLFPRLESGKVLMRLRTGRVFPRIASLMNRPAW